MVKIAKFYRRIGLVSTLGVVALLPGAVNGQQPTLTRATRVVSNQTDAEPLPAPVADAASADGATDNYASGQSECRNYNLSHRWECHVKPALIDSHWGYAPPYVFRPFGDAVRPFLNAQVMSGMAAQMVLYHYDFENGQLNLYGRRRALKIMECMQGVAAPTIVETTNNEALDETRRANVIEFMQQFSESPISPEAVVVGLPPVRGLNGFDALSVQQNLQQQMQSGGSNVLSSGNNIGIQSVGPSGTQSTGH